MLFGTYLNLLLSHLCFCSFCFSFLTSHLEADSLAVCLGSITSYVLCGAGWLNFMKLLRHSLLSLKFRILTLSEPSLPIFFHFPSIILHLIIISTPTPCQAAPYQCISSASLSLVFFYISTPLHTRGSCRSARL